MSFQVYGEQPWEVQQSPTEERDDPTPLQLALRRTRSPSYTSPPTSPLQQSYERRLSGDPDSPPPAWKRRPSVNTQRSGYSNRSQTSDSATSSSFQGSPPNAWYGPHPHPNPQQHHHPPRRPNYPSNLQMTRNTVAQRLMRDDIQNPAGAGGSPVVNSRQPMPRAPPGAYGPRRRAGTNPSSNRSSMHSTEGMNSEDLWHLDDTPDMSNPMRPSQERPLDTVRRMSNRWDTAPLPEALWPTIPSDMPDPFLPPPKTKSLTNMAGIKKRGTLRKSSSRASNIEMSGGGLGPMVGPGHKDMVMSSAHSSTTSLSIPFNKSQASLSSRPQSMALGGYGFDLMSALAPRDGGYAIAAQLSQNASFSPTSSTHSDRGSYVAPSPPGSNRQSRAPPAPAMMRWSVGDEELTPPMNNRMSPTSSNLSSYSGDEDSSNGMSGQPSSAPAMRSPLSQHTTAAEMASMHPAAMTPVTEHPPPIPSPQLPQSQTQGSIGGGPVAAAAAGAVGGAAAGAGLSKAKSKKEIKKEEKERARVAKLEARRAEDLKNRQAAQKKEEAARQAAQKKADDKARAKADKASKRESKLFKLGALRSSSTSVGQAPPASKEPVPPMPTRAPPAAASAAKASPSPVQPPVQAPVQAAAQPPAQPPVPPPVQQRMPSAPKVPTAAQVGAPVTGAAAGAAAGAALANNTSPVPSQQLPKPAGGVVVPPRSSSNRVGAQPKQQLAQQPAPAPAPPAVPTTAPAAPSAPAQAPVTPAPSAPMVAAQAPVTPPTHAHAPAPASTMAPPQRPLPSPQTSYTSQRNTPSPNASQRPVLAQQASQPSARGSPSPQAMQRPTPSPQSSQRATPSPQPAVPVAAAAAVGATAASAAVPGKPQQATNNTLTPSAAAQPNGRGSRSPSATSSVPSATSSSSRTATAAVPKEKKSGLLTNMKKRFSMAQRDEPTKQRVASQAPPKANVVPAVNGQRNATAPSVPQRTAHQAALPPTPPPKASRAAPEPPSKSPEKAPPTPAKSGMKQAAIPAPVIVPPRGSSLARPDQPEHEHEIEHHRHASLSNPSSVVVTPTTSNATNSSPSLFEVRPAPAFRDRSDSIASSGEGYESAVSDSPMQKPLAPSRELPTPPTATRMETTPAVAAH